MKYEIISDGEMRALPTMENPTETKHLPTIEQMKYISAYEKHIASLPTYPHRLSNKVGDVVDEKDFVWKDEYYCTESGCKIQDRCLHQGKPTLCGKERKPCGYCEGKGWYINEEHKKYPKVQQRLDCWYCSGSGLSKIAIPKEEQKPCNHEPLIDTGTGYYHCGACNKSWTESEWKRTQGVEEQSPAPVDAEKELLSEVSSSMDWLIQSIKYLNHSAGNDLITNQLPFAIEAKEKLNKYLTSKQ